MASDRGKVIIKQGNNLITNKDLILESEVSLGISNDYQPLLSGGGSSAVSAIFATLNSAVGAGFKQQGFQVWRGTNPVELKLSVSLHMVTSGKLDVVEPAKKLMNIAVPSLADNGWGLIPPGANILDILGDKGKELGEDYSFLRESKGVVSIHIGSYINLNRCVIRNVIPTYSLQEDSNGYPVSCKLDIDLTTLEIANNEIISNLST